MRSVGRNGPTLVTQSNVVPTPRVLRARERDRLRVGHPVDVVLDRLDDAPDVGGRRVDRDADAGSSRAARRAAPSAACCGRDDVDRAARCRARSRRSRRDAGHDVDPPVERPRIVARRGVRSRRCRRRSPSTACRRRERVVQRARRARAISASVASSKRAPPSASARRTVNGVGDAGGHHDDRRPSRTTHAGRARVERVGDEIAAGASKRSSSVVDARAARSRARRAARAGARSTRPTRLPWLTNGCACAKPGARWKRGAVAQRDAARRPPRRARARRARRRARGRARSPRARRRPPSPTIGYWFGTTRSVQPGRVGRAGAERARPRAASRARCPRQNGQVGDGSRRQRLARATRNVSGRRARAGRDDHDDRRSARRRRSCCIEGSG